MSKHPQSNDLPFVRWEEPPPARATGAKVGDWRQLVGFLKAHPNRWALAVEGTVTNWGGASTTLKKCGCEVAIRADCLYARFVSPDIASNLAVTVECPTCRGTGYDCATCNMTGLVPAPVPSNAVSGEGASL